MPDHAPSAADADAAGAARIPEAAEASSRPPVTPTTPNSPFTGSFSSSFHAARPSPARSFNLHALGFNTSPLGPLARRISFYDGDSGDDDAEDGEEDSNDDGSLDDIRRDWETNDDGRDNNDDYDYRLDDPIALEERKDVLIDRLNDVVRHVSSYAPSSPSLSNSNRSASTWNSPAKSASAEAAARPAAASDGTVLSALHAHIDEMEAVLAAAQAAEAAAAAASPRNHHRHHHHHRQHYPWQRPERRSRASTSSVVSERSPGLQGPAAKTTLTRRTTLDAAPILFRGPSSSFQRGSPPTESKAADMADNTQIVTGAVAIDCEVLAGDLSAVLTNLLKRRQESEMIQEALLQQLAAANSRTAELEAQVQALTTARSHGNNTDNLGHDNADEDADDDDGTPTETATEKGVEDDDTIDLVLVDRLASLDDLGSELSFLRLQLRGIEVRCRSYIPADADPELTESIENWKADWSALRAKVQEERRSTTTTTITTTTTSMNTSMSLLDKDNNNNGNTYNDMNSTF